MRKDKLSFILRKTSHGKGKDRKEELELHRVLMSDSSESGKERIEMNVAPGKMIHRRGCLFSEHGQQDNTQR
jgi:hypothetical protein